MKRKLARWYFPLTLGIFMLANGCSQGGASGYPFQVPQTSITVYFPQKEPKSQIEKSQQPAGEMTTTTYRSGKEGCYFNIAVTNVPQSIQPAPGISPVKHVEIFRDVTLARRTGSRLIERKTVQQGSWTGLEDFVDDPFDEQHQEVRIIILVRTFYSEGQLYEAYVETSKDKYDKSPEAFRKSASLFFESMKVSP